MKTFTWPEGTRCAVFVSVNFDAEAYDLMSTTESRLFGRFSYGRYGVRAGLPRLLRFFQRRDFRATIFATASDAERHQDAIRALSEAGHEIAARGVDLKPLPLLGAGEREALQRARDTLAKITGAAPAGFRAPGGELGASTLRLLAELGYQYDASFQDADHPYLFAPSDTTRLVEVPGMQALDDSLVYSARHTHARLMKIWREEFDALYDAGCLVPLTLHLRGDMGSTRAARIAALDGLFSHIASRPGVRFMTGAELAALTLSSGLTPEPDPVAMHQSTLSVTPYRGDLAVKPI
jgi:peptidoglycan/xylan/chitin deacetylase (PgdA/CDA1 family)